MSAIPLQTAAALGLVNRRPLSARLALLLSGVILTSAILWAAFPGLFTSLDPLRGDTAVKLTGPSLAHPFGTDYLGRDLLARMIYGARASLLGAALAVGIAAILGTVLGLWAALAKPGFRSLIMRFIDVLLSIPELLLAMLLLVILGFSTTNAAIAIGIAGIAGFARVVYAEALRISQLQFVEAAGLNGAGRLQIAMKHVLPVLRDLLSAVVLLRFGGAVLAISTLSFLGLGTPPPAPEWGQLVAEGVDFTYSAPWLLYAPAIVIITVLISINHLAQFLRGRRHD